jgi:hypothetical protein
LLIVERNDDGVFQHLPILTVRLRKRVTQLVRSGLTTYAPVPLPCSMRACPMARAHVVAIVKFCEVLCHFAPVVGAVNHAG